MLVEQVTFGRVRSRVLGIDPGEASFARRGFACPDDAARARLELVGRTFVCGYRAGLEDAGSLRLERALAVVDAELRGFAYEGAAMALSVLDQLSAFRRDRLATFISGAAQPHVYMAHVGAGWALARLRRRPGAADCLDPLLRWLALDGYGFHEGYFSPSTRIMRQRIPRRFRGYAARAFDQGLGRAVWFACGGDAQLARRVIGRFDQHRQPDLWSGLALAVAYAGPVSFATLEVLQRGGVAYRDHLSQGAAFAAAARDRAGNPAGHTELACQILAGCGARDAARLTVAARQALPMDGDEHVYEEWRQRLRSALAARRDQSHARVDEEA